MSNKITFYDGKSFYPITGKQAQGSEQSFYQMIQTEKIKLKNT